MLKYHCQECNEHLEYVEYFRSPFCEKPNCQRAKAQHYIQVVKKQIIHDVTEEVSKTLDEYLHNPQTRPSKESKKNILKYIKDLDSTHLTILPVNTNYLVQLNETRKEKFLLHLETIYTDIVEHRPPSSKVYTTQLNPSLSKKENLLLGKSCATCMGQCCGLGEEHAFQDIASLSHFLNNQTEKLALNELSKLYSQYFPNESYQNACVFQGKSGCTLPTELRSFTCNNYHCPSLISYLQTLRTKEGKLTTAAAVLNKDIKKITLFDEDSFLVIK